MRSNNNKYKQELKEHHYTFWGLLIIICLIIALVLFIRYQTTKSNNIETIAQNTLKNENVVENIEEKEIKIYTAEEIVNKLKENGLSIGRIVVYNEETDLNNLLGRPNQYITKANFEDIRIEGNEYLDEDTMLGGTVETFDNLSDLENRKEYCESLGRQFSISTQYIHENNYALLRIDNELTPTQAQEYEKVFNEIIEGDLE